MTVPEINTAERDRLAALDRYKILDTAPQEDFEDIVALAAQICGMPIALISLIDDKRQWFKAKIGLDLTQTSREFAFCAHVLNQRDVMIVNDAAQDERFIGNPLVTGDEHLRFYAGAPLETQDGFSLGTLCVLDREPREITPDQQKALQRLARQVMTQLELRQSLNRQRDDERRHRLIVDSAVDYAIITISLNGKVTSWSRGASQLMGWSEDEMCGLACDEFFTPEDCEAGVPGQEMGAALSKGRGEGERWHIRKDGSRFWASGEMMPLVDDAGVPIGFLKILCDRTSQRESIEALADSEARTRLALEAGELGAWETSPELGELKWDRRTRELLGHTPDEPLDYETSFLARIHAEDRAAVANTIASALSPDGNGIIDLQYRTISIVDDKERWVHAKGALTHAGDRGQRFIGTVQDVTAAKEADSHRILLTGELEHRIKNTLAVVQSIVSQSLRGVETPEEARDAIGERLATLSHAHDLLTQSSWTAAPMMTIVQGATRVLGARPGRLHIKGPDIQLSAKAALAFSMSLHELSTNAAKYGALSNDVGHVELTWKIGCEVDATVLDLRWQEFGGPPVNLPKRKGFGSRLMVGLAKDMGGNGELEFEPGGVVWTLHSQLAKITA